MRLLRLYPEGAGVPAAARVSRSDTIRPLDAVTSQASELDFTTFSDAPRPYSHHFFCTHSTRSTHSTRRTRLTAPPILPLLLYTLFFLRRALPLLGPVALGPRY